jgi:hypothetical protein
MSQDFVKIATDASAWRGPDLVNDKSWVYRFTDEQLRELDHALRGIESRGLVVEAIERDDFPLPTLGPRLLDYLTEIRIGRGFVVLRGLPVERYTYEQAQILYWGLGTHLGTAVRQNVSGEILGHVRDFGQKWGELGVRGYQTNGHLIFHTDFSDVVGLLCLRRAKSGGLSRIASSVTVHNEIVKHHPEYLAPLYRGFRYIRRESVESDDPVTGYVPVFGLHDGYLSCRVVRERIDSAAKRIGQPLSDLERDALDYFAAVAGSDKIYLDMDLLPGDMQFLNNYTILHSRTSYEDWPEPERQRHLLRLWLTMREGRRPLADDFPQANGYGIPGKPVPRGAHELGLAKV